MASTSMPTGPVKTVSGRGLPLRGNDIDTDRIMPARFLRAVSFDGLEQHLFEDDRKADAAHPFNGARYDGASLLIVNANFGSGSSREHAPQGLARAGFRAVVGESFAEIFFGNSVMLGIPCFTASHENIERLQAAVERDPATAITADVATGAVTAGTLAIRASLPPGTRDAFLSGQWNSTAMLLIGFLPMRNVLVGCA